MKTLSSRWALALAFAFLAPVAADAGAAPVSADVSIAKTLTTPGPFTAGQTVTYSLFVANAGPSAATSVEVTDTPTKLTIVNVSGGGCAALPCTIPSLAAGADATITVTATIDSFSAFDNRASVTAAETDTNAKNNTDNTGNGGSAGSGHTDLVLQKFVLTDVHVGVPFDFLLRLMNPGVFDGGGPDPASGVVLTDDLPPNFTLISATSTQGTCSGTTTVTCNLGTIGNGSITTITIRGTASSLPITNTAFVVANEGDVRQENNFARVTIAAAALDDVPTTSELGLMFMAVMLAVAGAVVMKVR